jgi:NTP pyrophosphatase (non-canonical NTP hydrolase)
MTNDEYIIEVLKTESIDIEPLQKRLVDNPQLIRLLHACMGMATEAGELLDVVKKHIFYGKEVDLVNIEEELGDLLWYENVAIDVLNNLGYSTNAEQIMTKNIAKLRARYGENFSEKAALNRNLKTEREILENKNKLICSCFRELGPLPSEDIVGFIIFCPTCGKKWLRTESGMWEEIK